MVRLTKYISTRGRKSIFGFPARGDRTQYMIIVTNTYDFRRFSKISFNDISNRSSKTKKKPRVIDGKTKCAA